MDVVRRAQEDAREEGQVKRERERVVSSPLAHGVRTGEQGCLFAVGGGGGCGWAALLGCEAHVAMALVVMARVAPSRVNAARSPHRLARQTAPVLPHASRKPLRVVAAAQRSTQVQGQGKDGTCDG